MCGFALCSVLVSSLSVGACLVLFGRLIVEGMSYTLEGGRSISWEKGCYFLRFDSWGHVLYFGRWPSATFFFSRRVVLLCVLCWFLVYQLGHVL